MFENIFAAVRKSTATAREQYANLRAEQESLRQAEARVRYAAAHKSDIRKLVGDWLDLQERAHTAALQETLERFIKRPDEIPATTKPGTLEGLGEASIFGLMAGQARAALLAAVDAMDWPDQGLPMVERTQKLAEILVAIGTNEQQQHELLNAAAEAGLDLSERAPA